MASSTTFDRSGDVHGSGQTSWKIGGKGKIQLNGMRRQKKQEEQHTQFWETVLEIEPYEAEAGPKVPRAVTMLMGLLKAFENIQLIVVWNWRNVLQVASTTITYAVWISLTTEKAGFSRLCCSASAHLYNNIDRGAS